MTEARDDDRPAPSLAEVAARLEAEAAANTSAEPPAPEPPPTANVGHPQPAKASRTAEGAWLGGVCAGLARHLGWPVLAIRFAFVLLGAVQFVGVGLYAVLWLLLPLEQPAEAPGLESHRRTGLRADTPKAKTDAGLVVALALVAAGLVWIVQALGWGWPAQWFWPFVLGVLGVGLVWRQADLGGSDHRWLGWLQILAGAVLVALGVSLAIVSQAGLGELPRTVKLGGIALLAVAAMAAPFAFKTRSALTAAREREILADARADMAAHLHDSVLQTLALIQRQADDPKAVATLARRQERELRQWLYAEPQDSATLAAALRTAAAEIEDERGVAVDLVVVGDADAEIDPALDAVVRAAREAMLNAAKHSGVEKVDVYAEVTADNVEVFVRDRGRGFSFDEVSEDRMGIRGSIVDRMVRHGGQARIRSTPGEGTEVRLEMTR